MGNGTVLDVCNIRGAARYVGDHVVVFAEPAVPSNFEQVCTLTWVWNQYPAQKIPCMRSDIFGERERSRRNVFVEEVDVVAFRVRWVVIERKIARQHGVLCCVSLC
jgi:hypothetical protein